VRARTVCLRPENRDRDVSKSPGARRNCRGSSVTCQFERGRLWNRRANHSGGRIMQNRMFSSMGLWENWSGSGCLVFMRKQLSCKLWPLEVDSGAPQSWQGSSHLYQRGKEITRDFLVLAPATAPNTDMLHLFILTILSMRCMFQQKTWLPKLVLSVASELAHTTSVLFCFGELFSPLIVHSELHADVYPLISSKFLSLHSQFFLAHLPVR
jgi:hypothetical protein